MPVPSTNAYRLILARKFPEPFIALLAFVLGVWLWDHYFGKTEGYPRARTRSRWSSWTGISGWRSRWRVTLNG